MNPHFGFWPPRCRTCSSPSGSTSPSAHTNLLSHWPLPWTALAHVLPDSGSCVSSLSCQKHSFPHQQRKLAPSQIHRGQLQARQTVVLSMSSSLSQHSFLFHSIAFQHCIVTYVFIGSPTRVSARWWWGFRCSGLYPPSLAPACSGGAGGLVAKSCPTFLTPWTVACQAPLSTGFSRQVVGTCK